MFHVECLNQMSSMWQMTPSTPSNICEMVRVNISSADEMPKGILLNANLPCGVMNVASSLDSSFTLISKG